MKKYSNGVLRDMTPEEIAEFDALRNEVPEIMPPTDDRAIIEEFIDRLAEADTLLEIIEIAKDIKARKEEFN